MCSMMLAGRVSSVNFTFHSGRAGDACPQWPRGNRGDGQLRAHSNHHVLPVNPRGTWVNKKKLSVMLGLEECKGSALRIGQHGHASDIFNRHGRHVELCTEILGL